MSDVSPQEVVKLRQLTGAGMMDAKRALIEADGDSTKAAEILRTKGLADAKRRSGRAATQGSIGHYLHHQVGRPVIGTLVELRCETDFVAKTPEFQDVARHLAMHVAAARPRWVTIEEVPSEVVEKEKAMFAAQAREQGKPEKVIPQVVEGSLQAFYRDNVLYSQVFINAQYFQGTVGEMVQALGAKMGEAVSVGAIARVAVGQG